mmetsp:Transcript_10172/g.32143  ORF Transcript_10172/g.32143 Transcript_10172/m.32143 type:complete len:326 (+) Transcript_10172:3-980(+)
MSTRRLEVNISRMLCRLEGFAETYGRSDAAQRLQIEAGFRDLKRRVEEWERRTLATAATAGGVGSDGDGAERREEFARRLLLLKRVVEPSPLLAADGVLLSLAAAATAKRTEDAFREQRLARKPQLQQRRDERAQLLTDRDHNTDASVSALSPIPAPEAAGRGRARSGTGGAGVGTGAASDAARPAGSIRNIRETEAVEAELQRRRGRPPSLPTRTAPSGSPRSSSLHAARERHQALSAEMLHFSNALRESTRFVRTHLEEDSVLLDDAAMLVHQNLSMSEAASAKAEAQLQRGWIGSFTGPIFVVLLVILALVGTIVFMRIVPK